MKVLTLNVHGWMENNSIEKIRQLAKTIVKNNYDVVALQEVNQPMDGPEINHERFVVPAHEVNPIPLKVGNYAGALIKELEALGSYYFWSWSANHIGYDRYDEGLAILSKSPQKTETINISQTTAYNSIHTRNVLKSKLAISGEKWIIFNGHFSWWQDVGHLLFKKEWDIVRTYLEETENSKVIFTGDFNNEASVSNEGYEYVLKTTPFLNDSYTTAKVKYGYATVPGEIDGWKGAVNDKRIDYVFVSNRLDVQTNNVIFDGNHENIVSDHFGIEVTLEN
ncbi:MAG: endonuclease/exonuclease/phosphatase family protein [Tetragenococcus sp.]|nr:endonuclease/exonuclease/phosphatase family protein [Tetragenococcus sp.]